MHLTAPSYAALTALALLAACTRKPAGREIGFATDSTTPSASAAEGSSNQPTPPAARPSAEQLSKLAQRVVATSVRIRPGDVVVIDGGKHTTDLMEAIAIEVQKAGGLPNMWLESDRVVRALVTEVPDKYIEQKPAYLADWYRRTNVWIGLGAFEDPKAIFADVPEAKLAKWAAAGQVIYDMLNASPIRGAFIDYPTPGRGAESGLPFARYAELQWAGIGADYQEIAATAKSLESTLQGAKQVHITSPSGTDIRFAFGRRPVIINAGIVSPNAAKEKLILNRFITLPGGSVAVAPQETSVTGLIVIPKDRCKFKPVRDARYEFANGTLTKAGAKEGDACVQENLTTYGAPMHRLGGFTIGLNPALKVVEDGGDYRPTSTAGLVTLSLGDNQLLGGANKVPGGVAIDLPVTHATVEIDGRKIVQDGRLVAETVAQTTR